MFDERRVVCHGPDGKPCGRLTEQECDALQSAGKGRAVRSRKGALVRFMLSVWPEPIGWRGGSRTIRRAPIRNSQGVAVTPPIYIHTDLVSSIPQG
jgi:hypothetical protein